MRPSLALVLAVAAVLAWSAEASACGVYRHASAHGPRSSGARGALVVGDSTMLLATPALGRHRIEADAKGCRQFAAGLELVRARRRAGTLPHLVVMALGANGAVSRSQLERLLRDVGRDRVVAVLTPPNSATTRTAMRNLARRHPDRVLLMDWTRYSAGRGLFAGDGLHPTDAGAAVLAAYIARLAAPVIRPTAARVAVPRSLGRSTSCGTLRRFGRRLQVRVVRGRISCPLAVRLAARAPLRGIPGWRWADWTPLPGPWVDVYARADRRVVVGTVPAPPRRVRRAAGVDWASMGDVHATTATSASG